MKIKLTQLTFLFGFLALCTNAQNRREQIENLTFEKDSLITLLNIEVVKNTLQVEKLEDKIKSIQNENNQLNKDLFSSKINLDAEKIRNKKLVDSLINQIEELQNIIAVQASENSTDNAAIASPVEFNPLLIWGNNQKRLNEYPGDDYEVKISEIDIDKDGTNELLTEYFTGGAHCCFIYRVFKKTQEDTYKAIYYHNGGENSLHLKNRMLYAYFFESLGYYHSAYASRLDDKLPNKTSVAYIRKVYDKGSYRLAETDETLNAKIIKNLEFLKSIPPYSYQSKEIEDGVRKSYAEQIISYYFNNNENIVLTKKLFDKYYLASDANKIFKEIVGLINKINE
jgi:hypothetical protein